MKTIRQSVFESNSSSTHSYSIATLNPKNPLDCTFIPNSNNEIHINLEDGPNASNATPQDKSALLLSFANITGDQELFDRVITVIELFTKAKVITSYSSYDRSLRKHVTTTPYTVVNVSDADSFNSNMEDNFSDFCSDLGHGSISEFVRAVKTLIVSDETIRTFIFSSNQGFIVESGYDG